MSSNTKIAVIGGTGKSGKYVVRALVGRGISSNVLVRNQHQGELAHPAITIVPGNVADAHTLRQLLEGCGAVISTLGLGIPPSEPTIFTLATANIITAMRDAGIMRYVVTAGLNVDVETDKKSIRTKAATQWMYDHFPVSTADRQREFVLLSNSGLDWTMVRLPMIIQTDEPTPLITSLEDCIGEVVSATSLANFLIDQISDLQYVGLAPFVFNS